MSTGTTVQIIGAVVDVEFPSDAIPKVYDALLIDDVDLTLEVQQQLGDGVVRTIAMGSSEGLKRGMAVSNTGEPIMVPVGEKTQGRYRCRDLPADPQGGADLRRAGGGNRASRDRHQGGRLDHADRQGWQDRPLRRCRRWQNGSTDGAHS
jgi:hypothetical protein